jgi:DNA-binding response OmpR family regulator
VTARHVLVVHDDADYRRIYRAALEYAGFEVTDTESASEAFAAFERDGIALVICDLYVHDLGDESFVALLRRDPRSARVPVLVVTAWTTPQHQVVAERAQVETCMSLPVTPKALIAEVNRLLGGVPGSLGSLGGSSGDDLGPGLSF